MFTKIFKSDYIFQFIFLMIISIIIWIKPFLSADLSYSPLNAPLFDVIQWFFSDNPTLKIIISFLLILMQALILKSILSSNDLMPKNSLLPAFLYILLMSSFANFQHIHPLLFANFFLIVALRTILTTYSKPDSYEQIFNATLLISIGSMFYFPVIFFLILIWLVFFIFSLLKWREWVISIFGFITPYLFLFSFYFLTDVFQEKMLAYQLFFKKIGFYNPHLSISNYIFLGTVGLLFIFSLLYISTRLGEKSIIHRKKVIVLIMFVIITILTLFFAKDFLVFHLCLFLIPFSYFFAHFMTQIKKVIISEIIYLVLFGAWIYSYLGF